MSFFNKEKIKRALYSLSLHFTHSLDSVWVISFGNTFYKSVIALSLLKYPKAK